MTHSGPKTRTHWMWRISSVLLLTLWTLLVVAPFAQAEPDLTSSLPACCRTHGAHHCAAATAQQSGSPTLAPATLHEKCPCTPASSPDTLSGAACLAVPASFAAPSLTTPGSSNHTSTTHLQGTSRANPKRGPPSNGTLL